MRRNPRRAQEVAGVHGNRTHLPCCSHGTRDLKSRRPTRCLFTPAGRAFAAEAPFMVRVHQVTSSRAGLPGPFGSSDSAARILARCGIAIELALAFAPASHTISYCGEGQWPLARSLFPFPEPRGELSRLRLPGRSRRVEIVWGAPETWIQRGGRREKISRDRRGCSASPVLRSHRPPFPGDPAGRGRSPVRR